MDPIDINNENKNICLFYKLSQEMRFEIFKHLLENLEWKNLINLIKVNKCCKQDVIHFFLIKCINIFTF